MLNWDWVSYFVMLIVIALILGMATAEANAWHLCPTYEPMLCEYV